MPSAAKRTAERPAEHADPHDSPFALRTAVWIIAVLAVAMFLRAAAALCIPVMLAVLLGYALNPLVGWITRMGLPRALAAAMAVAALSGAVVAGALALQTQAVALVEQLPDATARLREAISSGGGGNLMQRINEAAADLSAAASPTGGSEARRQQPPAAPPSPAPGLLRQGSTAAITLLGDAVVIAFLTYFLLVAAPSYYERFIRVGPGSPRTSRQILDEINAQIERFILVRIATAALVAVATAITLALFGVKGALFWGLAAGLFNSIPYFGPVIVSVGLLVVAIVQFGSLGTAALVAAAALGITTLEGWLITPPLLGKASHMSAVAVFLGLLLWAWIWGIWGTVLAMPMLVILRAASDHIDELAALRRLLDE